MHRTLTRRTRTLTLGMLLAAALPASAAADFQDLRTPDSRIASSSPALDLRTPDSRIASSSPGLDLRTPDSRDGFSGTAVELPAADPVVAAANGGFEWEIVALGTGAGVLLAGFGGIAVGRRRTGVAH